MKTILRIIFWLGITAVIAYFSMSKTFASNFENSTSTIDSSLQFQNRDTMGKLYLTEETPTCYFLDTNFLTYSGNYNMVEDTDWGWPIYELNSNHWLRPGSLDDGATVWWTIGSGEHYGNGDVGYAWGPTNPSTPDETDKAWSGSGGGLPGTITPPWPTICEGTPPPADTGEPTNTPTSTIDQVQTNLFYGIFLFIISFCTVLWIIKLH